MALWSLWLQVTPVALLSSPYADSHRIARHLYRNGKFVMNSDFCPESAPLLAKSLEVNSLRRLSNQFTDRLVRHTILTPKRLRSLWS